MIVDACVGILAHTIILVSNAECNCSVDTNTPMVPVVAKVGYVAFFRVLSYYASWTFNKVAKSNEGEHVRDSATFFNFCMLNLLALLNVGVAAMMYSNMKSAQGSNKSLQWKYILYDSIFFKKARKPSRRKLRKYQ